MIGRELKASAAPAGDVTANLGQAGTQGDKPGRGWKLQRAAHSPNTAWANLHLYTDIPELKEEPFTVLRNQFLLCVGVV